MICYIKECVYIYIYIYIYIYSRTYQLKHAVYLASGGCSLLNECAVMLLRLSVATAHLHVERLSHGTRANFANISSFFKDT